MPKSTHRSHGKRVAAAVAGLVTLALGLLSGGMSAPAASATPETVVVAGMEMVQVPDSGDSTPPPPPVGSDGVRLAGSWEGPWTFRNDNSNRCMDILGASKAEGARAVQYTCVPGGVSQKWYLWVVVETLASNGYYIGNANSGKCVTPHSIHRGGEVLQWTCSGAESQIWWTPNTSADSYKTWRNDLTGYYLEVQGGSLSNFAKIVSWTWHGRAHQRWTLWDA